jgi:hypothetical protein
MTDRPRFHVIHGTPPPQTEAEQVRERVRKAPRPSAMPQCHRCGGREYVETKIGAGKGATKQRVCFLCAMKGERVVM